VRFVWGKGALPGTFGGVACDHSGANARASHCGVQSEYSVWTARIRRMSFADARATGIAFHAYNSRWAGVSDRSIRKFEDRDADDITGAIRRAFRAKNFRRTLTGWRAWRTIALETLHAGQLALAGLLALANTSFYSRDEGGASSGGNAGALGVKLSRG